MIYDWMGIQSATPSWSDLKTVKQWWSAYNGRPGYSRKAGISLQMLVCWEIWNERNARVFRNKESPTMRVVAVIKDEAKTWVIAGARLLSNLIPGE